jgi:putative methyltransferase (TIGR04325 family)
MNLVADYFLPPQIKIFVRASLSRIVGFSPVSSWAEGVKKSSGYDTANTAVPIVANTKKMLLDLPGISHASSRFQQIATAMMFCLAETRSNESRPYRILDVGGGGGDYYFYFQRFIPGLQFNWTVLETKTFAQAFENRTNEQISWIDTVDDLKPDYDIVLMSGVLQYIEDWNYMLGKAASVSNFVILNRLPLRQGRDDRVALQRNRYGKTRNSYPAHFFSESKFLAVIRNLGRIEMQWNVPEDQAVFRWRTSFYQGLILRVKK